ncbi:hypothetical protein [Psychrobacter sp. I-STPA10]|uniref:hypothetical protein n=1 Tax=Psychrobacter sp. I-STPA10 TaxID=2585769 RepID=UPI001E35EC17|nr:hypothetical protein [Psychrobacter sp. I-STPA10]
MFKNRLENYWITRPDILHLNYVHDLNQFLAPYQLELKFISCQQLPKFALLQASQKEAQAIYNILPTNSTNDDYLKHFFKRYIRNTPLTWAEYQTQQNYLNLENGCYQDFLQFITHANISLEFDNRVYETPQPAQNWIDGNPPQLLAYYRQFFQQSDVLFNQYGLKKMNDALSFILSHFDYGFETLAYDSRIDFEARKTVIEAIYDLYAKLFVSDAIEHHRYMLWDGLAFSYTMELFSYHCKEEDIIPLQNVMFATLNKILQLDSKECQYGALHGLNHLQHPDTKTSIEQYIATQADLDNLDYDDIKFARACITGRVM